MAAKIPDIFYLEPLRELDETLEFTWRTLRDYFVAGGELPENRALFAGANLARSRDAAETVVANMLFEVAECVCRFSPWYTKPSRAFGITVIRDLKRAGSVRCVLAPEAVQKWEKLIDPLAKAIYHNLAVIQATLYVENLIGDTPEDECVSAKCGCHPPHIIRVDRSMLEKTTIYCNLCHSPFA